MASRVAISMASCRSECNFRLLNISLGAVVEGGDDGGRRGRHRAHSVRLLQESPGEGKEKEAEERRSNGHGERGGGDGGGRQRRGLEEEEEDR